MGSCHTTSGKADPDTRMGPYCSIVLTGFPGTRPSRVCIEPAPSMNENTLRPRGRVARATYSFGLFAWSWMIPQVPASGPYATQKVLFGVTGPSTDRRNNTVATAWCGAGACRAARAGVTVLATMPSVRTNAPASFRTVRSFLTPVHETRTSHITLLSERAALSSPLYGPAQAGSSGIRLSSAASNDVRPDTPLGPTVE